MPVRRPDLPDESTPAVSPGQPAADFEVDPYPGRRPRGSWVVDAGARCWPVGPDGAGRWVVGTGRGRVDLDTWLRRAGAAPLADRVPLLSYGSNACPGKVLVNRTPLPAVSLACTVEDLAAVWCAGPTAAGRTPVTLAVREGSRETCVLTLATAADLAGLDVVEGRAGGAYALVRLTTGRVVLADGSSPVGVHAYVGVGRHRWPLLQDGRAVRRVDVDHAEAERLRLAGAGGRRPDPLGVVVPTGSGR